MGGVREKGVNICVSALFNIIGGWATQQVEVKMMQPTGRIAQLNRYGTKEEIFASTTSF